MSDPPVRFPPRIAVGLLYLALLPFAFGAALVWRVDPGLRPAASLVLSGYAAVVISFIGALHWGLALTQDQPVSRLYWWGVFPSIVAWLALLSPPRIGLSIHAATLVGCYLVDRGVYPREGIAGWLPLRLRLTGVAVLCCLVGAFGS